MMYDVGWGACAYQMVVLWTGDPNDQARARINDTGKTKIIECKRNEPKTGRSASLYSSVHA